MTARRVLVARLDSDGDVLLSGPAIRAVKAGGTHVTLLVGPRGRAAAALLPGVDEILVWHCPWIDAEPHQVTRADVEAFVDRLERGRYDEALVLTSYHQSSLPLALLLRMAGVRRIGAASEDYPGSLLDVRHRLPEKGLHEVERACSTAAALGYRLPPGDDGRLAVRRPLPDPTPLTGPGPYVVVHPGASVPARAWDPARSAALVDALVAAGHRVVVTGGPAEHALTGRVAHGVAVDLGGRTDLAGLAGALARARAVVVGNTGPAHLAAAVGTPVVSLFAPTVPVERWAPYTPDRIVLGDLSIGCAGCRARACPVAGHPCLSRIDVQEVLAAVQTVVPRPRSHDPVVVR
ncbi:MAG TPA: glycosyltransferase family 9 protein [Frankiaceae bacterium]|nr:glycosyltransferase family 9 protein [Frankiaceae bacterium]